MTSTYRDPFFPFFEPGPFLGPAGPPIKSSKISPPTAVVDLESTCFFADGPGGGGTEVGRDAGVLDLLSVGVPSRLGVFGALRLTTCTGGPLGVPTLIGGAVGIGVEGEPDAAIGGGNAVLEGGTDCDFSGLPKEVVGGGAAAEPGRGGCFGGGGVAFAEVGSSLAA